MTRVAILSVPDETGAISYRAVAGEKHAKGHTAGEALDALAAQFSEEEAGMFVVVQNLHPDHFFTAAEQRRLAELMDRWRDARDRGETLPSDEQAELDALVEAEVRGAASRVAALADEVGRFRE